MTKARTKRLQKILWSDKHMIVRIVGTVAECIAFGAVYLVLMSALTNSAAALCAVFVCVVPAAILLAFDKIRFMWLYVLLATAVYTALCVAVGYDAFIVGAGSFINRIVSVANARMHWGFESIRGIMPTASGDFVFCSVLAVWLGYGCAVLYRKIRAWLIAPALALTVLWLALGLVPAAYSIVLFVPALLLLLIIGRGFTLKAGLCYLGIAAVVIGAVAPALAYGGSSGVKDFQTTVYDKTQALFYGSDDLPGGKLTDAPGMRSSRDVRLNITLGDDMRNLYLRGFVGGELKGNRWQPTDNNVYVSKEYQGLLDYVAAADIPFLQYSRYAELNGQRDRYAVTVENVSASRRYVYVPYTLSGISVGSANYDMNIMGNVFTSRKYTYNVFTGDRSYEGVSQAPWLSNTGVQTPQMRNYIAFEEQYRAFAHDTYGTLDGAVAQTVRNAMNVTHTEEKINPATNVIRNYFSTRFTYSDKADPVGNDFISEFFGGKIKTANAAYFASAAVVAFRMYGYAARYAEGYLVYADEGETRVTVTGNFSHAWVEVYFDGMGWLPIEVTPGFYKDMHEINPDDPNGGTPDEPNEPIKPPDEPDDDPPDKPEPPPEVPEKPLTPDQRSTVNIIKVLLPITSVALVAVLVVLAFVTRYTLIKRKRRNSLAQNGEAFGRAAYAIAEADCAEVGKYTAELADSIGLLPNLTERFNQIIEHCVYGGYEVNPHEREFIINYLNSLADAVASRGGKWHRFICKYIKCLGV